MNSAAVRAADPASSFAAWTAFSGAKAAPKDGEIQIQSNSAMSLPRGVSAQAIYVVNGTVDAAVKVFRALDATRYPELEVFQQRSFLTEADARFTEVKINATAAPFQRLLAEMAAPKNLQLTKGESARLPRQKDSTAAQTFWAELLRDRATLFIHTGNVRPEGAFDARSEIHSLLQEEPKIAAHFSQLLQPWATPAGNPGAVAAEHYWDVSSTQDMANFELGAIFERAEGDARQVADVTYYSSSSYLAAVSLYEFVPIAGAAAPQTLVWHGALLSSAEAAGALGLRRKFAVRTLESELRQWIGIFRKACAEANR